MNRERLIIRDYTHLEPEPTSHRVGLKKVLLSASETLSNVTQIAITKLSAGDRVEEHVHPTMDEHYFIISGEGVLNIDKRLYHCETGKFILIPAGSLHDLHAITDMELITIGVAI